MINFNYQFIISGFFNFSFSLSYSLSNFKKEKKNVRFSIFFFNDISFHHLDYLRSICLIRDLVCKGILFSLLFFSFFLSFSSNTFLPRRDKWYPVKTEQVENDEYLTERWTRGIQYSRCFRSSRDQGTSEWK